MRRIVDSLATEVVISIALCVGINSHLAYASDYRRKRQSNANVALASL